MLARREVALIPAAGLLPRAGARDAVAAARSGSVLALARTRDDAGRTLPGAEREVRRLARQIAGVEALVDDPAATATSVAARAQGRAVLHFAAHTRGDSARPWQHAVLVGRPGGRDAWLDASRIARLKSTARLCVLAGCSSLGGGGEIGETLEGLGTAWLAAGIPTVIATQWPVDDAATAELMHRFYEGLASGETAAGSLRAAQLEVSADPRFAARYYWAGVVLLGDPDTRVPLRRRGFSLPIRLR